MPGRGPAVIRQMLVLPVSPSEETQLKYQSDARPESAGLKTCFGDESLVESLKDHGTGRRFSVRIN